MIIYVFFLIIQWCHEYNYTIDSYVTISKEDKCLYIELKDEQEIAELLRRALVRLCRPGVKSNKVLESPASHGGHPQLSSISIWVFHYKHNKPTQLGDHLGCLLSRWLSQPTAVTLRLAATPPPPTDFPHAWPRWDGWRWGEFDYPNWVMI